MNHQRKLYIMRGCPGSGKSTLASSILAAENYEGVIYSTDDFWLWTNEKGEKIYSFDSSRLGEAHAWNINRACQTMASGDARVVIIDNTNVQAWEAKVYVETGISYDYEVHVREPETRWWIERDVDAMFSRNTHQVPREAIELMIGRWEDDFSLEAILSAEKPAFSHR
ncbi:hypothetical protein BC829DRAFT_486265 [Chytridium lagenaria]|nr:hypothetical protein BC829DRAFT_486265 [Chytridium lagenaria]